LYRDKDEGTWGEVEENMMSEDVDRGGLIGDVDYFKFG
jgi:hypothetical protein